MDFVHLIHAAAPGTIAIALTAAILSPRVRDGVVVKSGLMTMALGFGALAIRELFNPWNIQALERSVTLIELGVGIVAVGYLVRRKRHGQHRRRATDWQVMG